MSIMEICEVTPTSASNPDCPFNCIGCKHCLQMTYHTDELTVTCELENNDEPIIP